MEQSDSLVEKKPDYNIFICLNLCLNSPIPTCQNIFCNKLYKLILVIIIAIITSYWILFGYGYLILIIFSAGPKFFPDDFGFYIITPAVGFLGCLPIGFLAMVAHLGGLCILQIYNNYKRDYQEA